MHTCYMCGKELTDTNNSEEHIIPNDLGGRISRINILCQSCNSKASAEFENKFTSYFESIKERLNLARARDNQKGVKCKIHTATHGFIDIILKDDKAYPIKPFYHIDDKSKTIRIFCKESQMEGYVRYVIKRITNDEKKYDEYNIKKVLNIIDDSAGIIQFSMNIDDWDSYWKGINKIALGFATHNGIERNKLTQVFDPKHGKIRGISPVPYYPMGFFERLLEDNRPLLDKNYPCHLLILKTISYKSNKDKQKVALVCYIELFSTFQYYVVLNMDYNGPEIYSYHLQSLLKKELSEVKLDDFYYKDALIYLNDLKLSVDDVSGMTMDEMKRFFEKKLSEPVPYALNLESYLRNIIDVITIRTIFTISGPNKSYPFTKDDVSACLKQYSKDFLESLLFEIFHTLQFIGKDDSETIKADNFRFVYWNKAKKELNSTFFSIYSSINEINQDHYYQAYSYNKFNELCRFISPDSLSIGKVGEIKEMSGIYEVIHDFDTDFALRDIETGFIACVDKNEVSNQIKLKIGSLISAKLFTKLNNSGMSEAWYFKEIKIIRDSFKS